MAAEQLNEQEIQFKKRARRRLVGAIALVLLMVTVLPMLLDDRSVKTPDQEISITIPSEENRDFTSKVVPLTPETPQAETEPEADAEQPMAVDPEAPADSPEAVEPQVQAPAAKPAPVKKTAQPVAPEGDYVVQIGVFSTMASINQLQQKLLAQGYKSYTQKVATDKGDKIRLRAGPFADRVEAEKALAQIKDAGMSGMVVNK